MADDVPANGDGSPSRIPDWGQWLAREMRNGFNEVNRRMDEIIREPTRRIDALERAQEGARTATDIKFDNLEKEIATEREARRTLEGSLGTWRWIAGLLGIPGLAALILFLIQFAPKVAP